MSYLQGLKAAVSPWARRFKRYPGADPDFIIIGAQKAGTTALYDYLIQHPQVLPATTKEVHFFDRGHAREKGVSYYRSHFSPVRHKKRVAKNVEGAVLCGEATGAYMFYPPVAQLIAEALPGVRLIAILRNPVHRALSHYHHNRRSRPEDEKLSFDEAVRAEDKRVAEDEERLRVNPLHEARALKKYSYIRRGLYYQQLQRWMKFFDREQILILHSKELRENPNQLLQQVFKFLGIEQTSISNTQPRHVGTYKRATAPSTRAFLEERFREDASQLYELLGVDWNWFDPKDT